MVLSEDTLDEIKEPLVEGLLNLVILGEFRIFRQVALGYHAECTATLEFVATSPHELCYELLKCVDPLGSTLGCKNLVTGEEVAICQGRGRIRESVCGHVGKPEIDESPRENRLCEVRTCHVDMHLLLL